MDDQEIWDTLHRHLRSIFERDTATYEATTAPDLALYEWFVTPHRQDGLDFHLFMLKHGALNRNPDYRYDLLEPRLQRYGDTAIVSYTFMRSWADDDGVQHRTHNESRVLVKGADGWRVVHVHKSPASLEES